MLAFYKHSLPARPSIEPTSATVHRLPPAELRGEPEAPVTSVALSRCGNFGLVGTAGGRVDRYNMQSGIHRLAYRRPAAALSGGASPATQPRGAPVGPVAHDAAVTGVASDNCNRLAVSGGYDGKLRVWGFKKGKLQSEIDVGAPVAHLCLHTASVLCAVATDSHQIRMYDVEAARLVRRFKGHADRITCIQISEDCRWLVSSSMDVTVKVWDIPASQCLQVRVGLWSIRCRCAQLVVVRAAARSCVPLHLVDGLARCKLAYSVCSGVIFSFNCIVSLLDAVTALQVSHFDLPFASTVARAVAVVGSS